MQQQCHNGIKVNIDPSITPVSTFQQKYIAGIVFNTILQLAKFYHKATFGPSVSTFLKSINMMATFQPVLTSLPI